MLPKRRRLTSAGVRKVIAHGKGRRGRYLSVKSAPGEGRAAAVVSKRVAKTAVMRNELRRLLYLALRAHPLADRSLVVFLERIPSEMPKRAIREAIFEDLASLLRPS